VISTFTRALSQVPKLQIQFPESRRKLRVRFPAEIDAFHRRVDPDIADASRHQKKSPADELPQKTRTFALMIVSLTEAAEAISWYEQRMAIEKDKSAYAIRGAVLLQAI
jgi:hypothetical protein